MTSFLAGPAVDLVLVMCRRVGLLEIFLVPWCFWPLRRAVIFIYTSAQKRPSVFWT